MNIKKFRAWDKIDQRLITHEQDFVPLKVTNIGVFRLCHESKEDKWILLPRDRFMLMESLGVPDMHDTEIYEGDIVTSCEVKDVNNKMTVGLIANYDGILSIVCLSDVSCTHYDSLTHTKKLEFLSSTCTVLGNVFEDSELLPISKEEVSTILGRLNMNSTTPLAGSAPEYKEPCYIRP